MYELEQVVDYMNVKNGEHNMINFMLMLKREVLMYLNELNV